MIGVAPACYEHSAAAYQGLDMPPAAQREKTVLVHIEQAEECCHRNKDYRGPVLVIEIRDTLVAKVVPDRSKKAHPVAPGRSCLEVRRYP